MDQQQHAAERRAARTAYAAIRREYESKCGLDALSAVLGMGSRPVGSVATWQPADRASGPPSGVSTGELLELVEQAHLASDAFKAYLRPEQRTELEELQKELSRLWPVRPELESNALRGGLIICDPSTQQTLKLEPFDVNSIGAMVIAFPPHMRHLVNKQGMTPGGRWSEANIRRWLEGEGSVSASWTTRDTRPPVTHVDAERSWHLPPPTRTPRLIRTVIQRAQQAQRSIAVQAPKAMRLIKEEAPRTLHLLKDKVLEASARRGFGRPSTSLRGFGRHASFGMYAPETPGYAPAAPAVYVHAPPPPANAPQPSAAHNQEAGSPVSASAAFPAAMVADGAVPAAAAAAPVDNAAEAPQSSPHRSSTGCPRQGDASPAAAVAPATATPAGSLPDPLTAPGPQATPAAAPSTVATPAMTTPVATTPGPASLLDVAPATTTDWNPFWSTTPAAFDLLSSNSNGRALDTTAALDATPAQAEAANEPPAAAAAAGTSPGGEPVGAPLQSTAACAPPPVPEAPAAAADEVVEATTASAIETAPAQPDTPASNAVSVPATAATATTITLQHLPAPHYYSTSTPVMGTPVVATPSLQHLSYNSYYGTATPATPATISVAAREPSDACAYAHVHVASNSSGAKHGRGLRSDSSIKGRAAGVISWVQDTGRRQSLRLVSRIRGQGLGAGVQTTPLLASADVC